MVYLSLEEGLDSLLLSKEDFTTLRPRKCAIQLTKYPIVNSLQDD